MRVYCISRAVATALALSLCLGVLAGLGAEANAQSSTVYVAAERAKLYNTAGKASFRIRVVAVAGQGASLSVLGRKEIAGKAWLRVKTASGQTGWIAAAETTKTAPRAARSQAPRNAEAINGRQEKSERSLSLEASSDPPQAGVAAGNRPSLPGADNAGPRMPSELLTASIQERLDRLYALKSRGKSNLSGVSIETQDPKYRTYFDLLLKRISEKFAYPIDAYKARIEGQVYLKFQLQKDGVLQGVEVVTTSGFDILDTAAIRAIDDAAPFPPFAKSISEPELAITIDFLYSPKYEHDGGPRLDFGAGVVDKERDYEVK